MYFKPRRMSMELWEKNEMEFREAGWTDDVQKIILHKTPGEIVFIYGEATELCVGEANIFLQGLKDRENEMKIRENEVFTKMK